VDKLITSEVQKGKVKRGEKGKKERKRRRESKQN
jgi:hypothetical protein